MQRIFAAGAVCAAFLLALVVLVTTSAPRYTVWLTLENASQLIAGNDVVMGGTPIGRVRKLELEPDGQAAVEISINSTLYRPLRQGTRAIVRYTSLSGEASRYVELQPPGLLAEGPPIPSGGHIGIEDTTSAVEFDSLFSMFDSPTRRALRGVIAGLSNLYRGQPSEARLGYLYLNPALVASNDLFGEIDRDTPSLREFVSATSRLVTDLADRRSDLTGLVQHLATMMHAIGEERSALADALSRFPTFLTTANRTFNDLRGTLDSARPVVRAAIPVAVKLGPFMSRLHAFSLDAIPAMRGVEQLVFQPGPANDLVDLVRSAIPLRAIGVGPVNRNGRLRPGALRSSTRAVRYTVPELAYLRPYGVDLGGVLDYFSHGFPYDALRGLVTADAQVDVPQLVKGPLGLLQRTITVDGQTLTVNQRNRCPLSLERGMVWKPSPAFNCDPTQVPPGH